VTEAPPRELHILSAARWAAMGRMDFGWKARLASTLLNTVIYKKKEAPRQAFEPLFLRTNML
jgi:hypothetical protein